MNSSKREKTSWTKFREKTGRRKRRTANICLMKAGGRNLKIKPTQANSWQRPCFLDRAWLTGCLVLWRSSQLFFSLADLCVFPLLFFQKLFSQFSHEFNGLFLLRALWGSEACVLLVGGLSRLTAALMRCDKLSKL